VQVADQTARTDQDAQSSAESKQFLPVNANVPVQILSLGKNGGDTKQSNNSTAKSSAINEAWTDQSVDQDQNVGWKAEPKGHDQYGREPKDHDQYGHEPKGHDDHRGKCPKGHGQKGHDQYGHGPKGHGPDGHDGGYRRVPRAIQVAEQHASTDQDATSEAESKQFLPLNVNAPVQFLGFGKNGGDTKQSNNSTAKSSAINEAWTRQSVDQDQNAGGNHEPKGHDGWDGYDGRQSHGSDGSAFQGAEQSASTDQDATSQATSKQVAPVNLNVPVQILSFGSNGGDTQQSNNSTAKSSAINEAGTQQSADQDQRSGSGSAFQGASQSASTDQDATSSAKSEQIAPVNVNAPIQILSFGHNGGDTQQSNNSTAQSFAGNQAGTTQVVDQAQGLLG
jgi:hypothetical protein